jgi:hypothetical protein
MNEIAIGLDAMRPFIFEVRLMALAIGAGLLVHTFCMAGFLPPKKTPWSIITLLAILAGSSCGMIVGSVAGDIPLIFICSLSCTLVQGFAHQRVH